MDKNQLLLNYFTKKLTPEEEKQFNELLTSDTEFSQQFNFEKDLQSVIRERKASELKSKLIDFEKANLKEVKVPVKKLKPNYQKWAMAASVVLLVTLGWLAYTHNSEPNYNGLYDANYHEYPNTVFAITRGDAIESLERQAFVAYESGDYQSTLDNFNKIPEADRNPYFDFYMGISQLSLNKNSEAKVSFTNAITSGSDFTAEAHWYLALLAIKEKDKTTAIAQLKLLTTKFDYNRDKAQKLLKKLD